MKALKLIRTRTLPNPPQTDRPAGYPRPASYGAKQVVALKYFANDADGEDPAPAPSDLADLAPAPPY